MWLLGLSALIGNLFVIGYQLRPRAANKKNKVGSILVSNLAIADCLMGVYMLAIASADIYYRDVYVFHAEYWQKSLQCKMAGLISLLSSEASVFFLTVLSIDRFLCVVFPLSQIRLRNSSVKITVAIVWILSLVLSALPVIAQDVFGDAFYGRSSVCLGLPLTAERPKGWEYSVALFLGVNMVAFCIMTVCYVAIYHTARTSARRVTKSGTNEYQIKLATRMAFLIATDFCCWMPVIIMGYLSQAGVFISGDVYAWTAVLVLPLNSSLNPYLYTFLTNEMSKKNQVNKSKATESNTTASSLAASTGTSNVKDGK